MNLSQDKHYIQRCVASFEKIKSRFSREERGVLDKAYLVVCCEGNQLEISMLNPESLGKNYCSLLSNCSSKDWLVRLVRKKSWIQKQISELQKDLVYVNRQVSNVSEDRLWLKDFTVELRFGQLDFDLIEKLKHTEITDKKRTMMSRASIRIIIKPLKEVCRGE
ncbi:hypothetical protein KAR91_27185 [Candidatus Pacearchaeota archaeon]|nr:hypothetical protein [Candidatus Pacearchaeota archaeon]